MITPKKDTINCTYDTSGNLTNLLTQYAELKEQGKNKPPNLVPAGFKQGLKLHTLDSFTYTHDKVGNRLTKTEAPSTLAGEGRGEGEVKYTYSYDAIYRLLQSTPTKLWHNGKEKEFEHKAETFTYDLVGNRMTGPKGKLNYTYNAGNQLMSFLRNLSLKEVSREQESREGEATPKDRAEYTYDKNGNLTKKIEYDDEGNIRTITLYTYDYENRLIRVEMQKDGREKIVEFTYDPFGRRLSKSVHREERDDDNNDGDNDDDKVTPRATYYVYDNEDIIMEYNHKGKVTARYVHGLGIDEPLAIEQKGKVYYYHADGLGSITALTDAKGKIVQRYDYDSFGNLKHHGHKVKQPYTYTAREWDKETGLYYYRARYYDAKVGRFLQKDPIGFEGGINLYTYVGNNPVNFKDPLGLQKECCSQTFTRCFEKCMNTLLGNPAQYLWTLTGSGATYSIGSTPVLPVGAPALPTLGGLAGRALGGLGGIGPGVYAGSGALTGLGISATVMAGWGTGTTIGCYISCSINPCNY